MHVVNRMGQRVSALGALRCCIGKITISVLSVTLRHSEGDDDNLLE